MICQLFIIVFLMKVQLLELLGIHLGDVDPWWQVLGLQSLNV